MVRDHGTAERRSIALHGLIAQRLDDAIVALASRRARRWLGGEGPVPREAGERWAALLDGDRDDLAAALVRDDEEMRSLRQNTPFAGVVEPRERWRIIREVH